MKYLLSLIIFLISFQIKSIAQKLPPLISGSSDHVLLEETFDYPDGELPDNWWNEGAKAVIKGGKLYVDANSMASTVWLDKELTGNFIAVWINLILRTKKPRCGKTIMG